MQKKKKTPRKINTKKCQEKKTPKMSRKKTKKCQEKIYKKKLRKQNFRIFIIFSMLFCFCTNQILN